jgi:hypothetical protein
MIYRGLPYRCIIDTFAPTYKKEPKVEGKRNIKPLPASPESSNAFREVVRKK